MGDVADLVAALGNLDDHVARLDGDDRAAAQRRVAELIQSYGAPGVVGWHRDHVTAGGPLASDADLDEALHRLARPTDHRSVAARRFAVVAAAVRAFPERYGPRGRRSDVARVALAGSGILASGPRVRSPGDRDDPDRQARLDDEAQRCLTTLLDARDGSYASLRRAAGDAGAVQPDLPEIAPGCVGRLVDTTVDGDIDPTPTLALRLCARGLTLERACATVLDPSCWTRGESWCHMIAAPAGAQPAEGGRRYLEVVASPCTAGFRYQVWLDFSPLVAWGDRRLVTYRMSPPDVQSDLVVDGHRADGRLAVDEGSLAVVERGDRCLVTTTKRLRHASEDIGRAFAVLLCGAGYYELGAAFVEQVTDGVADVEECDDDGSE